MYDETSGREERDNLGERIFEKIMAKNVSNFQKKNESTH